MTEVWFRDPIGYMKECAELLASQVVWDSYILDKKTIDPQKHLELHHPSSMDYRILIVDPDGTCELRRGYSRDIPYACYPTWAYDANTIDELEEMLDQPAGDDLQRCQNATIPSSFRPVYGQEHRVMITRWPDVSTTQGKAFLRSLAALQEDYPEAIIHLWGSRSYRACFGMGFAASDTDPYQPASLKEIVLGNGKRIPYDRGIQFAQWVRMLGFTQGDLGKPSNRVRFNMKSAMWAAEHFESNLRFKSSGHDPVDPNTHHHLPATTPSIMSRQITASDGDKITCDTCSLFAACKYYREEAVCSLPGTDGSKLAGYFNTRSSDIIIEGLGKVLATQARRFERAAADEEYGDAVDNDVTKLGHIVMTDGIKLAKLVDPTLAAAGAAKIGVYVGGQHVHATPNALMAEIVRELESKGVSRDDITTEMVNEQVVRRQTPAIGTTSHE